MSSRQRVTYEEAAERIIDRIAEQVAEQPGITVADKVNAVRECSKGMMRACGIEIPNDVFERLVRELCDFNFIIDEEGAP
jgi:hypothetical protein